MNTQLQKTVSSISQQIMLILQDFNTKGQEQSYLKRGILTLECIIHITRYSVQFKTKELLHFII